MIIYRFERNGIGPYMGRSKVGAGLFLQRGEKTKAEKKYRRYFQQMMEQGDGLAYRNEQYIKAHKKKSYLYGCKSKQQLRAYFGTNFKQLFKEGYRIKRYNIPDDEVLDITFEVAFPVKYHKLQNVRKVKSVLTINT